MLKVKRFQRRVFVTLLGVALIPVAALLVALTVAFRWGVSQMGTAGAWGSVAESGQTLLQRLDETGVADSVVAEAASAHQEALSESLRFSQIFTLVADRLTGLLPFFAIALALLMAGLAYLAARQLSRGLSRPIHDLVGWTRLIGKGDPLPAPGPDETTGAEEFATLRSALRQMADDLERGREQAIQNAKLRSWTEMARRVAHELKNPLTPMRMAATTAACEDSPRLREAGEVLLEEISRLDELARSFSQFGKMPEGPPSEIDLPELLQGLAHQHRDIGPTLELEIPGAVPFIVGHYDALLRCFRNLLLNAVDASGEGGSVTIRAWKEGETAVTEIRDTGPGIPEDALERIWDPDFTTKSKGTGLGLALVRQTIQAHEGSVEGRNHPGAGAVFRVVLPIERGGA